MKIVILDGSTLGNDVDLSPINALGELTFYDFTTPDEVAERIADCNVIIANKVMLLGKDLAIAKNLKLICITATGTNVVDFDYTNKHNIPVANVANYCTRSVAEHTFAMLFYLMRKLSYFDIHVKDGKYCDDILFTHFGRVFSELSGKTFGIIGLGTIGRKVAEIATAFGCKVIYYSTSGKNNNSNYQRVELDELLQTSDIISVHCPLNDKTDNLIEKAAFSKMKKKAILLNLGRGNIINEQDLYEALGSEEIAAAGLDVISIEPMEKDNILLKIKDSDRLLITPHIAWASIEARQRVVDEVAMNIDSFTKGIKRNIV